MPAVLFSPYSGTSSVGFTNVGEGKECRCCRSCLVASRRGGDRRGTPHSSSRSRSSSSRHGGRRRETIVDYRLRGEKGEAPLSPVRRGGCAPPRAGGSGSWGRAQVKWHTEIEASGTLASKEDRFGVSSWQPFTPDFIFLILPL